MKAYWCNVPPDAHNGVKMPARSIVVPGERLSTEEEFIPGDGTFTEDGNIYSSMFGETVAEGGNIRTESRGRNVIVFKRGMRVLAQITDDIRTVLFAKVMDLDRENVRYVALKDGKIINKIDGPRGHDRGGERGPRQEKLCKVGDVVLATIIGEDKDIYVLGIRAPEFGVVYSECEVCGGVLEGGKEAGILTCKACGHVEHKKVSAFYNNIQEIDKILKL